MIHITCSKPVGECRCTDPYSLPKGGENHVPDASNDSDHPGSYPG